MSEDNGKKIYKSIIKTEKVKEYILLPLSYSLYRLQLVGYSVQLVGYPRGLRVQGLVRTLTRCQSIAGYLQ